MQSLETTNDLNTRIDWIDVCKAFAIFFIYFGHWLTTNGNLAIFAYSFHLQLFFLISGFFAVKQQKKKSKNFIIDQVFLLIIPFLFFTFINIVYFNLDGSKTFNELLLSFTSNFTDYSHSVSPELWFLPALFCVAISYYFLLKVIKKPLIILILAYILYIIETSFKETMIGFILSPFIGFMGISAIPAYLFWYSLGSVLFPYLKKWVSLFNSGNFKQKFLFRLLGISSILITTFIYWFKPDAFWNKLLALTNSHYVFNNTFLFTNFRIVITLIICFTFIFLSYLFRNSQTLSYIGKNTLILLGFEFIIKDFLVLNLIPMFNLGIVKLETTAQVITISILMIICVIPLFKPLNKHIPYLVGKRK